MICNKYNNSLIHIMLRYNCSILIYWSFLLTNKNNSIKHILQYKKNKPIFTTNFSHLFLQMQLLQILMQLHHLIMYLFNIQLFIKHYPHRCWYFRLLFWWLYSLLLYLFTRFNKLLTIIKVKRCIFYEVFTKLWHAFSALCLWTRSQYACPSALLY